MCESVALKGRQVEEIASFCVVYLSQDQVPELQAAADLVFRALSRADGDAMWFALGSLRQAAIVAPVPPIELPASLAARTADAPVLLPDFVFPTAPIHRAWSDFVAASSGSNIRRLQTARVGGHAALPSSVCLTRDLLQRARFDANVQLLWHYVGSLPSPPHTLTLG